MSLHAFADRCAHCLGQIGHQDFGFFRPLVVLTLAEHHGDVFQVVQPHPCGMNPKAPATLGQCRRDVDLGYSGGEAKCQKGFQGFFIGKFPKQAPVPTDTATHERANRSWTMNKPVICEC